MLNQKIFHLPDDPAQRVRDEAMRAAMVAELDDDDEGGGDELPISTLGIVTPMEAVPGCY